MNIGQNIKVRRLELGMSQRELADSIGYKSRSAIAKVESGDNDIPVSKLDDFARALDTSVKRLVLGYAQPASHEVQARLGTDKGYKCCAVILAGGKSSRNHQNAPNQFINVLGKPLMMYSVEAYQNHPLIDDIYVVCLKGWESVVSAYAKQYSITKLRSVVPAGDTGLSSIENGLKAARLDRYSDDDVLVVQETTRPFVSEETISKLLNSCERYGSSVMCEPLSDHLAFRRTGDESFEYIDRDAIVSMQSPDAHRLSALRKMFEGARTRNVPLSENCCGMLLHKLGMPLTFCEGTHSNIKIVRQEDLAVFTALLKQRN